MRALLDQLESSLIDEFIISRGYDPASVAALPEAERHALLTEASVYACARLTEVESRSRLFHDIHQDGGVAGFRKRGPG